MGQCGNATGPGMCATRTCRLPAYFPQTVHVRYSSRFYIHTDALCILESVLNSGFRCVHISSSMSLIPIAGERNTHNGSLLHTTELPAWAFADPQWHAPVSPGIPSVRRNALLGNMTIITYTDPTAPVGTNVSHSPVTTDPRYHAQLQMLFRCIAEWVRVYDPHGTRVSMLHVVGTCSSPARRFGVAWLCLALFACVSQLQEVHR